MPTQPDWNIPADLQQRLDADDDGIWEHNRWEPILLTVMKGTSYEGRDIPLAWQIEFEPSDDRDGDDWSEIIRDEFLTQHPQRVNELHLDAESSTCVIWVESEEACRCLLNVVWPLVQDAEA
jgi:hypothetical protein